MYGGEGTAKQRLAKERSSASYSDNPILFILSDGEPTDGSAESAISLANEIKQTGVLIVSCYVTSDDLTKPRQLYGSARQDWPQGAHLMFECASELPHGSPFESYMREFEWEIEPSGRLFTQVNQSEVLSEFMNVILSPLARIIHESQTRPWDSLHEVL